MIAKIIKLDDYLNEYINMNQPKIETGIAAALDISEESAKDLYRKLTHQQEVSLVTAFMDDKISDEQKTAMAHAMFDPIIATINDQPFGGVDIAEGYNFRHEITNEVARNNLMDWLEEHSIEYLIDNVGNFAVKCDDRKTHYRVKRQFENTLNRWDKGPVGRNVDPTVHRKALSTVTKSNILSDALNEDGLVEAAQDGSMPLADMSGTPPMFPATGDGGVTDGIATTFENTEEDAMRILGDHINNSSEVYIEHLEEEADEWLVCDDALEKSFVVDTSIGTFEEVQYICENVGGRGAGRTFGSTAGARSSFSPKGGGTNVRGMDDIDAPTKFVNGVEVPADAVRDQSMGKASKFAKITNDEYSAVKSEEDKIDLMIKHGIIDKNKVPERYWSNFIATHYNKNVPKILAIRAKGGTVGVKESKKKKKSVTSRDASAASLAANRKMCGQAGAMKDRKKQQSKDACRKNVDESVISGATGMTGMQPLGMSRLRQLAGLPESSMTVIEIEPYEQPLKNEPIVTTGKEIRDMDEALDHLNEVFNIYKTLNTTDKSELRLNLINSIMDDGAHLSESVIGLLLNDKSSMLLEFDGDGEHLSIEDKEYLNMVISDIKVAILEDIDHSEESVSLSLARVAYLLESLQHQMGTV